MDMCVVLESTQIHFLVLNCVECVYRELYNTVMFGDSVTITMLGLSTTKLWYLSKFSVSTYSCKVYYVYTYAAGIIS